MNSSKSTMNFIYNALGSILPIIISLATVPLYIHLLGLSRYGIVTLSWVLLGYFGFLDFGMSRASANALARLPEEDIRSRSKVFMTTLYSNMMMGTVGGLGMYFLGGFILLHVVKIEPDLIHETQQAYPWMAAMLPFGMLGGVLIGALESRERFLAANILGTTGNIISQILPLACAWLITPSLTIVIPAILLSRVIFVMSGFILVAQKEKELRIQDFSMEWLKKLFGYGSWVSISAFLNPILDSLNQVVIGAMLNAAAVAKYSVPMTLAIRSQVAATALARTLFPRLSRATHEEAVDTTQKSVGALAYGFAVICGPAILFSFTFLHFWIGEKFAVESGTVAEILLFGAWTNGVAFIPYNFLQAQGRPHVTAIVGMIEILPFLITLWISIHFFGLPGAAMAWTLRVTINALVLLNLSHCITRKMLHLLPVVAMMSGSLLLALLVPMTPLMATTVSIVAFLAFLFAALQLDPVFNETMRKKLGL
ncbi:flippase [Acetobacter sicerae]|uniref:flippase n=1 Tax=Acetobacter sicerae TaxID=85325 RepID=UPI00156A8A3C|nr:flippase [Acetobacter sicerae]NHN92263.1 oligosaccharide flippase family protein [Acetobacter sicerae]